MLQAIKHKLLKLGPGSPLLQGALSIHCRINDCKVRFEGSSVKLSRGTREMILPANQLKEVPIMVECFDTFFDGFVAEEKDGRAQLDFSKPGFHTYKRDGVGFHFPCIPEEESLEAYTHGYTPQLGDVVFDAGAHAGATSYLFSKMVGPQGTVFAFEPDDNNYGFLLKNIEEHHLTNVIPVKSALAGTTGPLRFNMDGTMAAGLTDYLIYSDEKVQQTVDATTLADACASFNAVPQFIKMDIEGAEVAVIDSSREFLKKNPINFAIESYHRVDDEYTYKALDRIFAEIGYTVESSNKFKQMFTWAKPSAA